MENLLSEKEIGNGFRHAEAFMHMQYMGQSNGKQIILRIWNSRDGVTPFTTYCKEYDLTLQHVEWQGDKFDKDYKPKKGDLVWVSHDKISAREAAEEAFLIYSKKVVEMELMRKQDREKFGLSNLDYFKGVLKDKEAFIKRTIWEILEEHGEPQPRLLLVKKDWI